MPLGIDPKVDCAGAPVVALGGREFFLPILALRQARIAVPGLLKLLHAHCPSRQPVRG